jgi:Major capsid protein N-terminus/Large eukaryotic DNA virus major capsid protein
MSSGRVQLTTVGLQDEYLSGTPDVTYFIKKFNRHTKFALEILNVAFNQINIDFGSWVNVNIPRNGQLIRTIYVKLVLPALTVGGYTNAIGNAIIEHADLVIGGQTIERINGEYMQIFNESFISDSQQPSLTYMVGNTGSLNGLGPATAYTPNVQEPAYGFYPRTFIVPLPFYFIRNEALSIPLCALSRQEVEIRIKFRPLEDVISGGYFESNVVAPTSIDWSVPPNYPTGPVAGLIVGPSAYGDTLSNVVWLPSTQIFACVPLNSVGNNLYYYDYNSQTFDFFSTTISGVTLAGYNNGIAQNNSGVTIVINNGSLYPTGSPTYYRAIISYSGIAGLFSGIPDQSSSFPTNYIAIACDGTNFVAVGRQITIGYNCTYFSSPSFTPRNLIISITPKTIMWSQGLNAYVIGDTSGNMYTYKIGESTIVAIPGAVGPYAAWSQTYGTIYNTLPIACSSNVISTTTQYSVDAGITWIPSGFPPASSIVYSPGENDFFTIFPTTSGSINSNITVSGSGSGYNSSSYITFAPSSSGITATANLIVSGGTITGVTVTNPGSGYITAPSLTQHGAGSGITLTTTLGSGINIAVIKGGSGYTNGSSVIIPAPPLGVQAVATIIVSGGIITGVTVTNPGSGYITAPSLTISGTGTLGSLIATIDQYYSIGSPIYNGVVQYPTEIGQFQASLPVEYVFLADEEVAYIQNAKIDYVITQLQLAQTIVPAGATSLNGYKLYLINPVKELFFVIQSSNTLQTNDYYNYTNTSTGGNQLVNLELQFNGEDIISPTVADALYLGKVQFLNNHTRMPNLSIYNYSFAIDPENYLPTGQVNMSRIMNQNMWLNLTSDVNVRDVRVYAKAYNILRVQNGLAGVLFIDNVTSLNG